MIHFDPIVIASEGPSFEHTMNDNAKDPVGIETLKADESGFHVHPLQLRFTERNTSNRRIVQSAFAAALART